MNKQHSDNSRDSIFKAIQAATSHTTTDVKTIAAEALNLLEESEFARPKLLSNNATQALMQRIEAGLVIGTSCEKIASLEDLPTAINQFIDKHSLPQALQVQGVDKLQRLNWKDVSTHVDINNDNTVGLCWAEYGIAETGSFVVHSSPTMPVLLNFLPFYLIAVIPKSKILPYMDDYALIANDIAKKSQTPRNICIISGASGTTDIEGVLVQGAHGPEILHIIIAEDE